MGIGRFTTCMIFAVTAIAGAQGSPIVKRNDSTGQQRKAAQTPLPVDPRERAADSADNAAARAILSRPSSAQWNALRRSANQAVRAHLIEMLAANNIDASAVVRRLSVATDAGERAALIRALGQFADNQISSADRMSAVAMLRRQYLSDPDPEVHSSIWWLLRRSTDDSTHRRPDWNATTTIDSLDAMLRIATRRHGDWRETPNGYTMFTIHPATSFTMGAPLTEARSDTNELQHRVRIPRSYAIASREVSVAQFQQYLRETGRRDAWINATHQRWPNDPNPEKFMAYPSRAQFAVTWYEAARYCNWLSKKEGIPKSQWVYPDSIGPGMRLPGAYLHRTGYRLPTEAEWEFAARAGNGAAHFFGDGVELLDAYSWYFPNAQLHGWPVGTKEPNQYGLFDMYDNAWEWLNDRWINYGSRGWLSSDVEDTVLTVTDDTPRIRRGGSWSYDKETTRSAHRGSPGGYRPPDRRDSVGFRIARTVRG